jgi:hypothetical protein
MVFKIDDHLVSSTDENIAALLLPEMKLQGIHASTAGTGISFWCPD